VLLNGRKIHLGRWGTKRARTEYHRLLAEWEAGGRILATGDPDTITVKEVIAAYWKYAERVYQRHDGSPTDELGSIRRACKPLVKLYGDKPASEFGPKALRTLMAQWVREGKWSRKTINHQIGRLKRIFRWATEQELVTAEVYHGLAAVSGLRMGRSEAREPEQIMPVPDAHIDAVRPHLSTPIAAMMDLQLLTGMRPGEVTIMRACDLDTSGTVWIFTPARHKTERHGIERKVYLGPKAQFIIEPFLTRDLAAYLFDPRDGHRESRAKARKGPGRRPDQKPGPRQTDRCIQDHYTTTGYGRAIRRACEAADVPTWSPNQLRHNAATRLRREHGIDLARTILGHRLGSAITEVYAEANMERVVDIIGRVQVIRTLVRQAKGGDVAAAKVLLERLFGKPFQELHLSADTSQYGDETYL